MTDREILTEKVKAMKEKYADVINDLAIKYGKDLGVAYGMLLAIPRAILVGLDPLYVTDIEINYDELVNDYLDYIEACNKVL